MRNFKRNITAILSSHEFFIFIAYFTFATIVAHPLLSDPDVGWHLKAGEYILTHHEIPFNDPWSFSSQQRWYNISWLWDVICGLLYKKFDISGLLIINHFLYAGTLAFAYRALLTPLKARDEAKLFAIIVAGFSLWEVMYFRPHAISFILTILCLNCVKNSAQDSGKKLMWQFPLMILVWVNMHGGFIVGFTIVGAFALQELLHKNSWYCRNLVIAGALGSIVTLINPIGIFIFPGILRTLHSIITSSIAEWQPFTFGAAFGYTFFVIILLTITNIKTPNISNAEKLLFYFWLFSGLISSRSMTIAVIIGLPIMARWMSDFMTGYQPMPRMPTIYRILMVILCIISLTENKIYIQNILKIYPPDSVLKEDILFIKENYGGLNFYNDYNSGGYLIFYASDAIKIFIDGRAGTAYSEDILRHVIAFNNANPDWTKAFELYRIDGVLLPKRALERFDVALYFKDWKVAHIGKSYSVLVRPEFYRGGKNENKKTNYSFD